MNAGCLDLRRRSGARYKFLQRLGDISIATMMEFLATSLFVRDVGTNEQTSSWAVLRPLWRL